MFVIPGLLIGFVALHLLMVLKLGINEWPMPGRLVRRSTYVQEYHELTRKDGVPFVPDAVWKDMFFAAAIIFSVMAVRCYLRTVRPQRSSGSHHHPDRPQAGFLLPVALCDAGFAAAGDGNSRCF